jgi:predicted transcriptional regulator of viral defense system
MEFDPSSLLFYAHQLRDAGWTPGAVRTAVARGALHRVRRGVYVAGEVWHTLDDRARHIVLAAAVVAQTHRPLLAGRSAAAVWNIPVLGPWPSEVTLLSPYQGGGKSEPGVRRTSRGARGAPTMQHLGMPVTSLARTVVDLTAAEGFVAGVAAADHALRSGCPRAELRDAAARRTSTHARQVISQVIEFADALSESVGESVARAHIFALGFEVPELQVEIVDGRGIIRLDFLWPDVGVGGEFDGKIKYAKEEYSRGDPVEVLWREKQREDRLRARLRAIVRIIWSDYSDLPGLARKLSDAGVPRRTSVRSDGATTGSNRA